jgi:hypothetical protein
VCYPHHPSRLSLFCECTFALYRGPPVHVCLRKRIGIVSIEFKECNPEGEDTNLKRPVHKQEKELDFGRPALMSQDGDNMPQAERACCVLGPSAASSIQNLRLFQAERAGFAWGGCRFRIHLFPPSNFQIFGGVMYVFECYVCKTPLSDFLWVLFSAL